MPSTDRYRHPVYLAARRDAAARSGGTCQLCGDCPGQEAHHWARKYPPVGTETPADC